MEAYLGYVMFTAASYAPRGWQLCQGQILSIAQQSALFSLLGTNYGGNGQTTFGLPHLGGRTPVGTGQAPGVSHNYQLGEVSGTESTTISSGQMPQHVHALAQGQATANLVAVSDNTAADTLSQPEAGARLGAAFDSSGGSSAPAIYVPAGVGSATVNLPVQVSGSTGIAGGSQALSIMQPYLALNAVICVEGLFPPRD
jgi:microcystin-dependent protein